MRKKALITWVEIAWQFQIMILEAVCLTQTHCMFRIYGRKETEFFLNWFLVCKTEYLRHIKLACWCCQNCIDVGIDREDLTFVPHFWLLKQIILGDRSEQKAFKYTGITCFNPGSFSNDYTFVAYRPSTQEVELSAL